MVDANKIDDAYSNIKQIISETPLQYSQQLSLKYDANIYLKREDLQIVRSYKIRGAYNFISHMTKEQKESGVVCASAGNHAQGVAYTAKLLSIPATIFMPTTTPHQKIDRVKHFGGHFINIELNGDTFHESSKLAQAFGKAEDMLFIHPFDDEKIIAGQGTVAKEILHQAESGDISLDMVICPIGGGGLISGVGTYIKEKSKTIKVVGVEPDGAASMYESLKKGKIVTLSNVSSFVDGVSVAKVGDITFEIAQNVVDEVLLVDEGYLCTTMIELYQDMGIVTEPAGALSISALSSIEGEIKGKTVVCVISGGNNDILRYPEIVERSLVSQGRKHYFIINFAQKAGELKIFLNNVLGPDDDISRFEYIKKNEKEKGPALVGIELPNKSKLEPLIKRMDDLGIEYTLLKNTDILYNHLV